jgi:4-amino-4-deoxy-L-arabinose transferase-like glycosyltransferase
MNKASPHKKEHINIIVHILLAIFGISAVFMVLKGTALYGPGISSDALHYVRTAENLAKGKGFYSYDGRPYTHWPPLYPSLIALLRLIGFEPLDGARTINAVSFALVVICSGIVFAKRIKSPLLILLGSAGVLVSATMLRVSVYAWTEPLFALLVILFMLSMTKFLRDGRLKFLLIAGVCAALAALQRYVGIAVIMAGAAMVLLLSHKTGWRDRLKYSAIFGAISCAPLGLWFLRNKFVASTAADYSLWLDTTFLGEITETLDSLTPWFVTNKFSLAIRLVIIGVLIILMAAAVIIKNRKFGKEQVGDTMLVKAAVVLIAAYSVFATIASVYANADADYRIYSAVYVFIILLFLTGLEAVAKLSGAVIKKDWAGYLVVTILCCFWLVFYPLPLVRRQMAYYTANGVPGYNSTFWRDSPLLNWVRMHPLNGQVFSNEPHPLVLLAGVNADLTPARHSGLEGFKNQLSSNGKNYLVWYYRHWRTRLYNLEELNSQFKLKPVAKLPDGEVFEIQ